MTHNNSLPRRFRVAALGSQPPASLAGGGRGLETTMNAGIDHACALATARSTTSRAIRAHYQNLAAYWRLYVIQRSRVRNPLAIQAATRTFTPGVRGSLPGEVR